MSWHLLVFLTVKHPKFVYNPENCLQRAISWSSTWIWSKVYWTLGISVTLSLFFRFFALIKHSLAQSFLLHLEAKLSVFYLKNHHLDRSVPDSYTKSLKSALQLCLISSLWDINGSFLFAIQFFAISGSPQASNKGFFDHENPLLYWNHWMIMEDKERLLKVINLFS